MRRGGGWGQAIDLLGIVSASQALSSETSVARLHARVVQVLSQITGATGVDLLLWSEDRQAWLLPDLEEVEVVFAGEADDVGELLLGEAANRRQESELGGGGVSLCRDGIGLRGL